MFGDGDATFLSYRTIYQCGYGCWFEISNDAKIFSIKSGINNTSGGRFDGSVFLKNNIQTRNGEYYENFEITGDNLKSLMKQVSNSKSPPTNMSVITYDVVSTETDIISLFNFDTSKLVEPVSTDKSWLSAGALDPDTLLPLPPSYCFLATYPTNELLGQGGDNGFQLSINYCS